MEEKDKAIDTNLKFSIVQRLKKIEKELKEIKDLLLEVPEIQQTLLKKEKEEILFSFKSKRGNEFQAKIKVKPEEIIKIQKEEEKFKKFKLISPLQEIRKKFFSSKDK